MNAELLLKHFNRISDAPNAVPRLRRFILDLAVRGKLVGQDPSDQESGALAGNSADKIEFPRGWVSGDMGRFLNFQYGKALPASARQEAGPVPVFGSNGVVSYCERPLSETSAIIIGRKGSAGALNLCDGPSWTTDVAYFVEPPSFFSIHYLYFALQTLDLDKLGKGVKPGLSRNDAYLLRLCVPPLAEQHRIVAKIDELMALCDQLEATQRERESCRDRLAATSHHHLNNGADAETLRSHAQFFIGHLPRLTARPDHIKQIRQTILNLAVRGRLLATSWPCDEVINLGMVATLQNGYAFKSEWFVGSGVRLLRNANVSHGIIQWNNVAHLSENRAMEFERFRLEIGDIVFSLDRPFIVTGTKVARIQRADLPCLLLQRVGRFQLKPNRLCADYLFLWLRSPYFAEQIDPGRSNGVPHVSSKQVEAAEIWTPSIAEQHRIVSKVDELMALCDRLESKLMIAQTEASHLLESVLHNALDDPALLPQLVS